MKKIAVLVLSLLVIPLIGVSNVYAQEDVEKIINFDSNITVNKDATINVSERIIYQTVPSTPRHGLMWTIPYIYSVNAFKRPTEVNIQKVVYYPLSNADEKVYDKYSRSEDNGWITLKIGDENTYIEGTYVYEIEYILKYSGISYFKDNDEVYLNIIGPGWNIPIENAHAYVSLPATPLDSVCYTGPDGSKDRNCTISQTGNSLDISVNGVLNPYEGYTFAVKLPKGVLKDTTNEERIAGLISNIGIVLPIPVGVFLFVFQRKKYKNKKITVVPNYEPQKDMDVLLSGILISGKYVPKHITAVLIELATKGYLKIREYEEKKYEFVKGSKDFTELPEYLKILLEGIFKKGDTVKTKDLKNFFNTTNKSYMEANAYLKENGIISSDKVKKKNTYSTLGIIIVIACTALSGSFISSASVGWMVGIILSGALLFIFALGIDTRTIDGNERYYYLLGMKMYIDTAEKHRIEFHNDPDRYNEVFEKLLPYAILFGLEKKWAKLFEDIYVQNPDWYEGNFTTFNAYYLATSLNTFDRSFAKSISPQSAYGSSGGFRSGGWSSGGSGFGGGSSGGGAGGSGGGGW